MPHPVSAPAASKFDNRPQSRSNILTQLACVACCGISKRFQRCRDQVCACFWRLPLAIFQMKHLSPSTAIVLEFPKLTSFRPTTTLHILLFLEYLQMPRVAQSQQRLRVSALWYPSACHELEAHFIDERRRPTRLSFKILSPLFYACHDGSRPIRQAVAWGFIFVGCRAITSERLHQGGKDHS